MNIACTINTAQHIIGGHSKIAHTYNFIKIVLLGMKLSTVDFFHKIHIYGANKVWLLRLYIEFPQQICHKVKSFLCI